MVRMLTEQISMLRAQLEEANTQRREQSEMIAAHSEMLNHVEIRPRGSEMVEIVKLRETCAEQSRLISGLRITIEMMKASNKRRKKGE